jgi:Acetoacetate decarboxylase (ADC)
MSYEFLPGVGYRMPSHFGPSPGPRQKVDGTMWQREEVIGNTTTLSVSYLTHSEKLEALLPPRFELFEAPIVTVSAQNLKNLWWLAGRGYNILSVTFRATYCGEEEHLTGNFMPVLWESLADPILTGRDELGFPKLWAEMDDIERTGTSASTSAAWLGFKFAELDVVELAPAAGAAPPILPSLFYKYMPRTGEWGEADAAYVTSSALRPGATPALSTMPAPTVKRWSGKGRACFSSATWEQLPTLVNIVNALADLEPLEFVRAGLTETTGGDMRVAVSASLDRGWHYRDAPRTDGLKVR